jgi:hypothetical protein
VHAVRLLGVRKNDIKDACRRKRKRDTRSPKKTLFLHLLRLSTLYFRAMCCIDGVGLSYIILSIIVADKQKWSKRRARQHFQHGKMWKTISEMFVGCPRQGQNKYILRLYESKAYCRSMTEKKRKWMWNRGRVRNQAKPDLDFKQQLWKRESFDPSMSLQHMQGEGSVVYKWNMLETHMFWDGCHTSNDERSKNVWTKVCFQGCVLVRCNPSLFRQWSLLSSCEQRVTGKFFEGVSTLGNVLGLVLTQVNSIGKPPIKVDVAV